MAIFLCCIAATTLLTTMKRFSSSAHGRDARTMHCFRNPLRLLAETARNSAGIHCSRCGQRRLQIVSLWKRVLLKTSSAAAIAFDSMQHVEEAPRFAKSITTFEQFDGGIGPQLQRASD